ncbi:hypothetical protein J3E74DRAFT_296789 [Bipolaris maydis]|nr:hypothetical protein J3E74DRAFT_296789 [Bipolaris maydis]
MSSKAWTWPLHASEPLTSRQLPPWDYTDATTWDSRLYEIITVKLSKTIVPSNAQLPTVLLQCFSTTPATVIEDRLEDQEDAEWLPDDNSCADSESLEYDADADRRKVSVHSRPTFQYLKDRLQDQQHGPPRFPLEHIASPTCQSVQGINGHKLSVAEMKGCRNHRFLLPKPSHWVPPDWKPEAVDNIFEKTAYLCFREKQTAPTSRWRANLSIHHAMDLTESRYQRIVANKGCWSPLFKLPVELLDNIFAFLDDLGVSAIVATCGTFRRHAQPLYRRRVIRDMSWFWEVPEGRPYPASPDWAVTWEPCNPPSLVPPELPLGLETRKAETEIWAQITADDPNMSDVW